MWFLSPSCTSSLQLAQHRPTYLFCPDIEQEMTTFSEIGISQTNVWTRQTRQLTLDSSIWQLRSCMPRRVYMSKARCHPSGRPPLRARRSRWEASLELSHPPFCSCNAVTTYTATPQASRQQGRIHCSSPRQDFSDAEELFWCCPKLL